MTFLNSNGKHRGQTMTEFLICASFVLIPLFLGLSMLAKYIDIKQTAIQAARYEAWEYTVWYATDSENIFDREMMSGFGDGEDDKFVVQPLKSVIETKVEARQRFYTNPKNELPITSTDKVSDWSAGIRRRTTK